MACLVMRKTGPGRIIGSHTKSEWVTITTVVTAERWREIEKLFAQAIEHPLSERKSFLDHACGEDEDLRRELESLLDCDDPEECLVNVPVLASVGPDMAGRRIGAYRVDHLIGHGGMGSVYLGVRDDDHYRKQVAIKVLKRGMDTEFMLGRFRQERQILANLEHPFIARLLDGGATEDGLPYFVMEYVDGNPITKYCAEANLSIPERLRLFRLVCEAVQHAHQNLVVHRDIKPSNILTTKEGIPKLLDFGIAKVLQPGVSGRATVTHQGFRMLTPDYASPEQVKGLTISTASDIYSLGAVLYEVLTGQRPHRFTSGSFGDMEKTVCELEPEKPSAVVGKQWRRQLSGDLDNIILTAMRKEPQRRYASAAELSEDLRRHMEHMPILAREDRWTYRAVKFINRNRMGVAAGLLLIASLIGGMVTTAFQARRAERRFQEVRTLANSVLFEIHAEIETLPGATRARELMVRTVLRYLNNLARESSGDPSLQWELATAYQKVGDVQGYGLRPNLGQRSESMESHRRAVAIGEKLAARGYDPKVQRLLAVSYDRIGHLIEGTQTQAEGGIEYYRRAQELLERLNRDAPGNAQDSPILITVYGHQGDAEFLRGRLGEAAASWQRTLDLAEQWSARHPSEAARLELGVAHWRVSKAAQLTGDLLKALEHARTAIAIHEQLAAGQPSSTARQRELLNSYERLSYVAGNSDMLNLGDQATAYLYNRKVVAIAEALQQADPNNTMASSDLVIAKRFACAFMPDLDAARVVHECQEVLDTATGHGRQLIEVQPSVALRLAPALMKLGRHNEAAQTMLRATHLLAGAIQDWPWRTDLRLSLIRVHRQFGTMLLAMGKAAQALSQYRAGLAIAEELRPSRPQDLVLHRELADCYTSLGQYYERRDLKQAGEWYKKDLAIWSSWPRRAVSSRFDQGCREMAARNLARCAALKARM